MADGHENLMIEDLRTTQVGVDIGEIADVVSILLDPPDHGIFGIQRIAVVARAEALAIVGQRAIVADLHSAIDGEFAAGVISGRAPARHPPNSRNKNCFRRPTGCTPPTWRHRP